MIRVAASEPQVPIGGLRAHAPGHVEKAVRGGWLVQPSGPLMWLASISGPAVGASKSDPLAPPGALYISLIIER